MLGSINEPKEVMAKELSQVLADQEFPVGAKVKKLAYGPTPGRLGVAPSALMPALATEVSQARRDWPSYQPASEAVFTMPATPGILKKRRLAGPGIWDTIVNSIKKDWKWWLGGSIALVVVVAIVAGGGKK